MMKRETFNNNMLYYSVIFLISSYVAFLMALGFVNLSSEPKENQNDVVVRIPVTNEDLKLEEKNLGGGFYEVKYKNHVLLYHVAYGNSGVAESVIELKEN